MPYPWLEYEVLTSRDLNAALAAAVDIQTAPVTFTSGWGGLSVEKIGGVVYPFGQPVPQGTATVALSSTTLQVATLPDGFRPRRSMRFYAQLSAQAPSGNSQVEVILTASGVVSLRIVTGASITLRSASIYSWDHMRWIANKNPAVPV